MAGISSVNGIDAVRGSSVGAGFCFDAAAAKYHVSPLLIKSMAIGESNLDPHATNDNRDKKRGKSKVPTTD